MSAALEEPQTDLSAEQLKLAQASFVEALPRLRRHAYVHSRGIRDPGRRDDFIATSLGRGWQHWLQCYRDSKDPSQFVSAIADYAVRATRAGRRVDHQESAGDVMSPVAQRSKGFTLQSLPDTENGVDDNEAIDALADPSATPPGIRASLGGFDFAAFIDSLGPRNGALALDMAKGERTDDLARMYCITPGRVSQLRESFADKWRKFHGENRER